ncbi:MAG: hypothetical protein NTW21_32930 [Verrucomicrobia bacterium]|nr:hypothetical protein [Verrucomicrobiota bacterium]
MTWKTIRCRTLYASFLLLTGMACGQSSLQSDVAGNLREISAVVPASGVTILPSRLVVKSGAAARLSAFWAKRLGDTAVWKKGGVATGQTGDAFSLAAVGTTDEADYSVTVTTPSGTLNSTSVHLYIDSDGDGLGDSWEMAQFGSLAKLGNQDTDGDGVTNAEEFEDGTNANSSASRYYRLTVSAINGRVTVSPASATGRYATGTRVTLQAEPATGWQFREWTGDFTSFLPSLTLTMYWDRSLAAGFYQPAALATAVAQGNFIWTSGGSLPWLGEGEQSVPDGTNLVHSGQITHGQESWIETTVAGPGTVSWWWKVSCDSNSSQPGDWLRCYIDGEEVHAISGWQPLWQPVARTISSGNHAIRWVYAKDASVTSGDDMAWLDKVAVALASPTPLADAIELSGNLTLTASGAGLWARQTAVTHDGADALQSPAILDAEEAWLQTTVVGPGVLRFWWKLSSADYMDFTVDGVAKQWEYDEADWTYVELYLNGTEHLLKWRYSKNATETAGADAAWLDQVSFTPSPTLPAAVDNNSLAYATNPAAPWMSVGTSTGSHDGNDFAQSGPIGDNQQSWLETTVTGPGTISFWWNVSSSTADYLQLLLDGSVCRRISGTPGWNHVMQTVPSGSHKVRWSYVKDSSGYSNSDTAYLDEIVWSAANPPPLANAVDAPTLAWTGSGDAFWERNTTTIRDGSDSAQAGPFATAGQTARMETTVTGPGVLRYWWKCSCASTSDTSQGVRMAVNGALTDRISGTQEWVQVIRQLQPGPQLLTWEFVRPNSSVPSNSAWLDGISFVASATVPLDQAADSGSSLTWRTGGHGTWSGFTATSSHDGSDMLASPHLADGESSWIETTVNGPGTLSFWWRISSEAYSDTGQYYVDGYQISKRSGEVGWEPFVTELSAGPHTIRWVYQKDGSYSVGDDAAFLDQVVFTPSAVPPLADAIDNTAWSWHSNLAAPWFKQTAVTHDGIDAAQSGVVAQNQSSQLGGMVTGPGTLTFWWKIDATTSDRLYYYEDTSQITSISGSTGWVQLSRTFPAGKYFCSWRFDKYSSTAGSTTKAWIDQVVFTPASNAAMAAALDIPAASPFTLGGTTGGAAWAAQSADSHDGVDALRSPVLANNKDATFETTVFGAGVLSFWYQVSSEKSYDYLAFWLDHIPRFSASGEVGWTKFEGIVGPGEHPVLWSYSKNGSVVGGRDAAWVDQLTVVPPIPLATALDTTLALTTGGSAWEGQAATVLSHDGIDLGASGAVSNGQESWMEATVNGAGTLSFFWKASCYDNYDFLRFSVDGEEIAALTGETAWQAMSRTLGGGTHTVRWTFQKGPYSSSAADQGYVDQLVFTAASLPALADAIDQPAATVLTSSGAATWAREISNTHDASDAAQSGVIGNSESSSMEAVFTGPGTLTYWCKVSSESGRDYLRFFLDGVDQKNELSGDVAWQMQTILIPAGTHRCQWRYAKDSSVASGSDAAWVDQVVFLPGVSFATALDTSGVAWTSGGDLPWQGLVAAGGVNDMAVSGIATTAGAAWLEANFTGPGTLSFDWSLSSYSGDSLALTLDGEGWGNIVGSLTAGWETRRLVIPAGTHQVRWTHHKNSTSSPGQGLAALDHVVFSAAANPPLGDALDDPSLIYVTGGNSLWDRQTAERHDGSDAAQSGTLLNSQASWMGTYLNGPGLLTYWAKVSSQPGGDYLRFIADGTQFNSMSGALAWQQIAVPVPDGRHSFEWNYSTNSSVLTGSNRAWVDQVNFTAYGNYPLGVAMDVSGPIWSTGPAITPASGVQTATAHDGTDAVLIRSPADGNQSWLETTIQGATLVKFWWRADSGRTVRLLVDGVYITTLNGSAASAWAQVSTTVDNSPHVIRWEVTQTSSSYPFSGVWLDELTGLPPPATSAYQQWQTQFGLTGANAAPLADFDRDTLSNLVEFAFNLDPTTGSRPSGAGSSGRLPLALTEGTGAEARLVLEYLRRQNSDLIYTPLFSDDLSAWSTASGMPVITNLGGGWELVRVADSVTLSGRSHRHGRVKVTMP